MCRTFMLMLTQFLVVLSVTLLTVGPKMYIVLKHRARGPAAGMHLVAVVARGCSSHRSSATRQTISRAANTSTDVLNTSLVCSMNMSTVASESRRVAAASGTQKNLHTLESTSELVGNSAQQQQQPSAHEKTSIDEDDEFGGVYIG